MIERHPLDTPIDRASLEQLPVQDMMDYIERIRHRRLEPIRIYEAGVVAKEMKAQHVAAEQMQKRLDQFVKVAQQSLNALEKMEKYAQEIQGYRLVLGDDIRSDTK